MLEVSSFEVDTQQASDLVVLNAKGLSIAARVRRPGYADAYGHDFTIRLKRDNGQKTEMRKILDGWADWMFYGHAHPAEAGEIIRWMIIDLKSFRAHWIRELTKRNQGKKTIRCGKKSNEDGTHFAYFDSRTFPDDPPILIAASHTDNPPQNFIPQRDALTAI